jgi:hypothetical protein
MLPEVSMSITYLGAVSPVDQWVTAANMAESAEAAASGPTSQGPRSAATTTVPGNTR